MLAECVALCVRAIKMPIDEKAVPGLYMPLKERRTFSPDTSGQRDAHNNKYNIIETKQELSTPKLTSGAWDKANEPAKFCPATKTAGSNFTLNAI